MFRSLIVLVITVETVVALWPPYDISNVVAGAIALIWSAVYVVERETARDMANLDQGI